MVTIPAIKAVRQTDRLASRLQVAPDLRRMIRRLRVERQGRDGGQESLHETVLASRAGSGQELEARNDRRVEGVALELGGDAIGRGVAAAEVIDQDVGVGDGSTRPAPRPPKSCNLRLQLVGLVLRKAAPESKGRATGLVGDLGGRRSQMDLPGLLDQVVLDRLGHEVGERLATAALRKLAELRPVLLSHLEGFRRPVHGRDPITSARSPPHPSPSPPLSPAFLA